MTAAQQIKYWRRWGCVARVNHWRAVGGRLVDQARFTAEASEWHVAVWQAAGQLAGAEFRGVTVEDLRKGCHVAAFGQAKSSKALNNAEFNALLILWGTERDLSQGGVAGLLIDPADLASLTAWRAPQEAERRGLVVAIRRLRVPDELIDAICRHNFEPVYNPKFYEDLPLVNLRALMKILIEVKARSDQPLAVAPVELPF